MHVVPFDCQLLSTAKPCLHLSVCCADFWCCPCMYSLLYACTTWIGAMGLPVEINLYSLLPFASLCRTVSKQFAFNSGSAFFIILCAAIPSNSITQNQFCIMIANLWCQINTADAPYTLQPAPQPENSNGTRPSVSVSLYRLFKIRFPIITEYSKFYQTVPAVLLPFIWLTNYLHSTNLQTLVDCVTEPDIHGGRHHSGQPASRTAGRMYHMANSCSSCRQRSNGGTVQ